VIFSRDIAEQVINKDRTNTQPGLRINEIKSRLSRVLASDLFIALALFLLVLLTRIPFTSQILYHWDSVNFAVSITQFDLENESPHPPGYIVYVWLIRAFNLVVNDPQLTMVVVSILSSALAVVSLFFLGKAMASRNIGLIASLFLATSPLFWFYGEIALPHTLDAFIVIISAFLLYKTMRQDHRFLYPAVFFVALAGGLRPQTLVFLLPLVLFAARRAGLKHVIQAGLLGAVICLLWFIPLISLSGGLSAYLQTMSVYSDRFQESTSIFMGAGFPGIQRNAMKVALYTLYGLSLTILPMLAGGIKLLKTHSSKNVPERYIFMLFWITPALFFYLAIHMGQQGLVFVFLPVLFLLAAECVVMLFQWRRRLLIVLTAGIIFVNSGIFLVLPEHPFGPGTQRMLTRQTLVNSDHYYQTRLNSIATHFDPEGTIVVGFDWRHAEFYLPEYTIIPLNHPKWDLYNLLYDPGYLTLRDLGFNLTETDTAKLVLFDQWLVELDHSVIGTLRRIPMEDGSFLFYHELNHSNTVHIPLNPIRLEIR